MHPALVTVCLLMQGGPVPYDVQAPALIGGQHVASPAAYYQPISGANYGAPPYAVYDSPCSCQSGRSGGRSAYDRSFGGCQTCGAGAVSSRSRLVPTGDMFQHYAYEARPKVYYYFRPYSPRHPEQLGQSAATWGAHPRVPHSREQFQRAYESVESQLGAK